MSSIWDLANPQLRGLPVYEPGKPIEETARELGAQPDEIIKLASNENPLGPSPKAIEAMRNAIENAHLYPDGGAFYFRNASIEASGTFITSVCIFFCEKAISRCPSRSIACGY